MNQIRTEIFLDRDALRNQVPEVWDVAAHVVLVAASRYWYSLDSQLMAQLQVSCTYSAKCA